MVEGQAVLELNRPVRMYVANVLLSLSWPDLPPTRMKENVNRFHLIDRQQTAHSCC